MSPAPSRLLLLLAGIAVLTLGVFARQPSWLAFTILALAGTCLACAGLRLQSAAIRRLEADADRFASNRQEAVRQALADERCRVAQELHDMIGCSWTIIALHAGAARRAARRSPEQVDDLLGRVESVARTGLAEARRLEEALWRGGGRCGRTERLVQVATLADLITAAGCDVALSVAGPARELPAEVEHSAYRIVQESLTNALRHAGATAAEVKLQYSDDQLEVSVADNGVGGTGGGTDGTGLQGMRRRARELGGQLRVDTRSCGGRQTSALLPARARP